MNIAIEGQRLFREKKHGMDFVALELIKNLMLIDKKNKYFIFVAPGKDKCLTDTQNFKIIELKSRIYPIWEQIALPKAVKKYKCDLLHCTSNTAPLKISVPLVLLLHDIIYMESVSFFKKSFSLYQRFGNIYRRLIVPNIVKNVTKIVTISNYEKRNIQKYFKLTDDKIVTIHNGVSSAFKTITNKKLLQSTRIKFNLPQKYLFFLSNTDPRKNTKRVLKAYSDFVQMHGNEIKLVMLDYDETKLNALLSDIGNVNLRKDIYLTGYVNTLDLTLIYNMSELLIFPSLREGFGMPILEAMRCGTPVITSNTSSMPEIAGNAAKLVNPYQSSEITNAIIEIIEHAPLRQKLIDAGKIRANKFSWKFVAQQNLLLYKQILQ